MCADGLPTARRPRGVAKARDVTVKWLNPFHILLSLIFAESETGARAASRAARCRSATVYCTAELCAVVRQSTIVRRSKYSVRLRASWEPG